MKIRGAKVLYYAWLSIVIIWCIVSCVAFSDFVVSGRREAALAISIVNSFFVIYLFISIRKYVFVLNTENDLIQIGNIFFKEKVKLSEVEIKKIHFMSHTYRIKYRDKDYWFMSILE
jgi:hypothetical protein